MTVSIPQPTRLDRALATVAPQWAANRLKARISLATAAAYYDGATTGRRGASIRRSSADAVVIASSSLPRLRSGSHDLVRNNAHAKRAIEAIVSNTVGTGISPQFTRDGVRADDIEDLARRSLETTECDAAGLVSLGGIQALALAACAEGGEVIVRRRWRRTADGLAVPVQFQVLEGEYLDLDKNATLNNGGRIVQGVEFDPRGRKRQYWLLPEHPGSRRYSGQSKPVPARDIAHMYRIDRPGQVRGIPWAAPVLLTHADFADHEEAQLMRQKIAACFVGIIREAFDNGIPTTARQDGDDIIDSIEPGMMHRLRPGEEIEFGSPPSVGGYGEFSSVSLHKMAMGWGVSYEALTGDLRGVNFSSGKMGRLEFQRNIGRWQQNMLVPMLCSRLIGWWLEAAALTGVNTDGVRVRHVAPRNEMVDPTKEMKAEAASIKSGQVTWSQSIRRSGRDPQEHFEEYAEDLKRLDALGITVDSDARVGSGGSSEGTSSEGGNDELAELVEGLRDLIEAGEAT